jgi:hypothetical protein
MSLIVIGKWNIYVGLIRIFLMGLLGRHHNLPICLFK